MSSIPVVPSLPAASPAAAPAPARGAVPPLTIGPDDPATLERNLQALGDRHRDLAERLRALPAPTAAEDGLVLEAAADGLPTGTWRGRRLASRHRPGDEAARLVAGVDLVEHGTIVVHGFGLGLHLAALAGRLRRAGLVVVLERDLELLRGVLGRIDHAAWLQECLLVVVEDPTDRALVAARLAGAESILGLGLGFVDHPPSRPRLGTGPTELSAALAEAVANAKVTLVTTLLRSVDTTRNLTGNLHRYAVEPGIDDLAGTCAGRTALCIAAGPSLHRTLAALEDPALRERAVLVAAQTTLRPLLERGIRPHFVTALDYHAISKRFYETLDEPQVRGITLIADPKVHPDVLDVWPGRMRLIASDFLDELLADERRAMGALEPSATVAHLSMRVARHLGCDPIVLLGQDLGFPGNLYYAPGNPIHDVWATELGPFNTIATMEWQRIVRHRRHLSRLEDVDGRSILTDAQMLVYLRHLERDIAAWRREGVTVVDATGGGARKDGAVVRPIEDVVAELADAPPLPAGVLDAPPAPAGPARARAVAAHLRRTAGRVAGLGARSRETSGLLERMIRDATDDPGAMGAHFRRLDELREAVGRDMEAFHLVDHLNQLGVFRRLRADRRLELAPPEDARERQRRQFDRDRTNVAWIAEAADELVEQLEAARRRTDPATGRPGPDAGPRRDAAPDPHAGRDAALRAVADVEVRTPVRAAAVIAVDPVAGGLGTPRDLARPLEVPGEITGSDPARPPLARVLDRLADMNDRRRRAGRTALERRVLLVPESVTDEDLAALAGGRGRLDADDVEIVRYPSPGPLGPAAPALRAARAFAATSWRGGPFGLSAFDEVLPAAAALAALEARGLTAALLVGADWAAVDTGDRQGLGALLDRHAAHPDHLPFVFTQAPPGRGGAIVARPLLAELAHHGRLGTLGAMLGYQPHAPQGDPVARDANVEIDPAVRRVASRLVADTDAGRAACAAVLAAEAAGAADPLAAAADALAHAGPPPHLLLEVEGRRPPGRRFRRLPGPVPDRAPMSIDDAAAIVRSFGPRASADAGMPWTLSLDGHGDPLAHPEANRLHEVVDAARAAGAAAVHLRTTLGRAGDHERVLAAGVDVVSIDVHADDDALWRRMHGVEGTDDRDASLERVFDEVERLLAGRRHLAGPPGAAGIGLPWIVPRLERRAETHEQQDAFFERWMRANGIAVIDAPPRVADAAEATAIAGAAGADWTPDPLVPAVMPPAAAARFLRRRMIVHADGRVPLVELDAAGRTAVATVGEHADAGDAWSALVAARTALLARADADDGRVRLRDA